MKSCICCPLRLCGCSEQRTVGSCNSFELMCRALRGCDILLHLETLRSNVSLCTGCSVMIMLSIKRSWLRKGALVAPGGRGRHWDSWGELSQETKIDGKDSEKEQDRGVLDTEEFPSMQSRFQLSANYSKPWVMQEHHYSYLTLFWWSFRMGVWGHLLFALYPVLVNRNKKNSGGSAT